MQLIAPEILIEARGLSPGAGGFLLLVGFFLWLFGWRWHRFWVVFGMTLTAGLLGLSAGRAAGGQILAVGVLLALSAGMLALELARIVAFITGGTAAWVTSSALLPGTQELWVVFLCGGLLAIALYRLWTMLATSFLGLLICWHVLLVMAEQFAKIDSPKLAAEQAMAINGALVLATLLGVYVQSKTGRAVTEEGTLAPDESDEKNSKAKSKAEPSEDRVSSSRVGGKFLGKILA
jgi:hypothetical protein